MLELVTLIIPNCYAHKLTIVTQNHILGLTASSLGINFWTVVHLNFPHKKFDLIGMSTRIFTLSVSLIKL